VRLLGIIIGVIVAENLFHLIDAFAYGLKAESSLERIGAVFFGVLVLGVLMVIFRRLFSAAFFNGFTAATGLFLSFDIAVFHWIFQLHRITNGPEANWLEPLFVIGGSFLVWYGVRRERMGVREA
jgi:hypothetical protein